MTGAVPFDTWARFYDATVPGDRPDRPFFVEYCGEHDGPVLELGCGTGDIYLELIAAGVDAYGIDLSSEMLDVLRRKATQRGLTANVKQADITDFSFEVTFGTVIGPLNIVRHASALADQRAVFRNVADALDDDGQFVFWIDLPDIDELCAQRADSRTTQQFEHDGRAYELEIAIGLIDEVEQTVAYAFSYTDLASERRVAEMEFEMALVPKQQLDLLLTDAGFSEWTYYNGAELEPMSTTAEPVVCIADR